MKTFNPSILRLPAAAAMLCVCAAGMASGGEKRAHDAHEHGHGLLNVAVDGEDLAIELEVPGVNVVGFEHAPESDEQKHAVEEALATFSRGGALFLPTAGADCELENVEVSLGEENVGGGHDEHDHDKHEHAEKEHEHDEKEHEHAEKEHEHDHEGKEAGETHTALLGRYQFHCHKPDQLHGLEVKIFEHLRDIEEIDVQIVTPTVQGATELEPGATVLKLTD